MIKLTCVPEEIWVWDLLCYNFIIIMLQTAVRYQYFVNPQCLFRYKNLS